MYEIIELDEKELENLYACGCGCGTGRHGAGQGQGSAEL